MPPIHLLRGLELCVTWTSIPTRIFLNRSRHLAIRIRGVGLRRPVCHTGGVRHRPPRAAAGSHPFDTAEIYGAGRSERILAGPSGGPRVGLPRNEDGTHRAAAMAVRQRALASANRLGVRRLDLYQVHWPNPLVPDWTIMRGMRSMRQAGLVGEVGVSNYSLRRWRAAEEALGSRILSNQVRYSLLIARQRQPCCRSPIARPRHRRLQPAGTRCYRPGTTRPPAAEPGAGNQSTVPAGKPGAHPRPAGVLREVADAHDASAAQIAMAWVIHRPAVAAIPGASSLEQLESNVAAAEIKLADDDDQALCTASPSNSPTAGPDASPHRGLSELARLAKFALKHSAKAGWYVAKTAWHDHKIAAPVNDSGNGIAPPAVPQYAVSVGRHRPRQPAPGQRSSRPGYACWRTRYRRCPAPASRPRSGTAPARRRHLPVRWRTPG